VSYQRNLLLARIATNRGTPQQLSTATDYLTTALALNPGSIEARQLLMHVYEVRKLPAEAATQAALIHRLQPAN
jgi:hypothetical protein